MATENPHWGYDRIVGELKKNGVRLSATIYQFETSFADGITELSERLEVEHTFLYHSLELVNLAPDIISAVLKSTIPPELKLKNLRGGIPTSWEEQRMLYGFKKP